MRPLLLLVGSGSEAYRGYLVASLSRRCDLWLLTGAEVTWQAPHLAGWTLVDLFDPDAVLREARRIDGLRHVHGVLCFDEALILQAAGLAAELGLPGMSPEAVGRCRDKGRTRAALASARVPQARSLPVSSLDEARAAAAGIGYPVVLKPRGLGASRGVVLARSAGGLDAAFAAARSASYPGVPVHDTLLVEEYLDGEEISVDGFVAGGDYRPLFLARKETAMEPYFEESGHVVDPNDLLLDDGDLRRLLVATHRALGPGWGITHTEVRLTARGPRVVEVNGRLGGDLIPYLGWLATGVDPGLVAVQLATGIVPEPRPVARGCVGIRFCYPERDCRVKSVHLPPPAPELGFLEAGALAKPGAELRLPPNGYVGRHAFVICEAPDVDYCRARLAAAAAGVRLEWQGLGEEPGPVPAASAPVGRQA